MMKDAECTFGILKKSPVDQSYVGEGNILGHDVEVKSERSALRENLIVHYMYCFKMIKIEWL